VAILSEAYSYADFPTRIAATKAFVTEILRLVADRATLMALCRRLDDETATQGARASWCRPRRRAREPRRRAAAAARLPADAQRRHRRDREGVRGPAHDALQVPCFVKSPAPVRAEPARLPDPPRAAAFRARAGGAAFDTAEIVQTLRRHGLRCESLTAPTSADVEVAAVRATQVPARIQKHQRGRSLDFSRATRNFPWAPCAWVSTSRWRASPSSSSIRAPTTGSWCGTPSTACWARAPARNARLRRALNARQPREPSHARCRSWSCFAKQMRSWNWPSRGST